MTEQNQRSSLLGKVAAYTEILTKDPESTIFVSLGEAYRKMGMLDDARQVIELGIATHQDFSPAYTVHARILCQQGDYPASETAFEAALQFDHESLAALVGYARLNILLGKETKARELLLSARELSPADSVINKLLLSLPAEVDREEVQTEEPVEEDAQPPLASATLAELYLKQGLEQKALEIYRQLSAEDPNNLVLRRQIRDLEEQFNESLAPPSEPESASEPEETPHFAPDVEGEIVIDGPEENQNSSATEPVSESAAAILSAEADLASSSEKSRILNSLNRWLDGIQQRRSDV